MSTLWEFSVCVVISGPPGVSLGILNLIYINSWSFFSYLCVLRDWSGGVVVECRTPNQEVLGSIPKSGTVLCP